VLTTDLNLSREQVPLKLTVGEIIQRFVLGTWRAAEEARKHLHRIGPRQHSRFVAAKVIDDGHKN
jgi:hypothetical protein